MIIIIHKFALSIIIPLFSFISVATTILRAAEYFMRDNKSPFIRAIVVTHNDVLISHRIESATLEMVSKFLKNISAIQ